MRGLRFTAAGGGLPSVARARFERIAGIPAPRESTRRRDDRPSFHQRHGHGFARALVVQMCVTWLLGPLPAAACLVVIYGMCWMLKL